MTGIVGGGGGGGYDYVQNPEPVDPSEGEEWYDTGANKAFVYDGAAWIEQTVTSHGALSGLDQDDHPQYATDNKVDSHTSASNPHSGSASTSALNSHESASNPHSASATRAESVGATVPTSGSNIRFGNPTAGTGTASQSGVSSSDDESWWTVDSFTIDVTNILYVRVSGEVRFTGDDSQMAVDGRVRWPDGSTTTVVLGANMDPGAWSSGTSSPVDVLTDTGQLTLDVQVLGDGMDGTNTLETRNFLAEYNLTEADVA